jgi:benzoate/toluate 1,2-dioxygenase subunit beta
LTACSNFVLVAARGDTQQIWAGRSIHRLRRGAGSFKIAHKKVLLVNADQEMPLLQFLI